MASDMRASYQRVEQQKQLLLEKARIEKETARDLAHVQTLKIMKDKKALAKAITFIEPIILQQKFPSMDDVRQMADQLFSEIQAAGQVTVTPGRNSCGYKG